MCRLEFRSIAMVALLAPAAGLAQADKPLSLASPPGSEQRHAMKGGENVRIIIQNMIPKERASYSVTFTRRAVTLPAPLSVPADRQLQEQQVTQDSAALTATGSSCKPLADAAYGLGTAANEAEVAARVAEVRAAIGVSGCDAAKAVAHRYLRLTEETLAIGTMPKGEEVTIQVKRPRLREDQRELPPDTWTMVLSTPAPNQWITTVGMLVIHQQWVKQRDTYISTSGETAMVKITEPSKDAIRSPAITFAYNNREATGRMRFLPTVLASVSTTSNELSMAVGLGWVFRDQLVIGMAAAIHPQSAPKREYESGDVRAPENATTEQVTRTRIVGNPALIFALRLDRNIFGGS